MSLEHLRKPRVKAMVLIKNNRVFSYLAFALRVILAAIFIFSGISKLTDVLGFRWAVANLQLFSWTIAILFSYLIPLIEILLGVLLLIGLFKKFVTIHLGIFIVALGGISYFAWKYSQVRDCNCLGKIVNLQYGIPHMIFLAVLLALDILVFLDGQQIWSIDSFIRKRKDS